MVDQLAGIGAHPVVLDRQTPRKGVDHLMVDLADTRATEEAVRLTVERRGRLDAVVTAAGIDVPGPLATTARDTWERVVAVNLLGTAAVVRAALPQLLEQHGRVVTIASTLGHRAVGDATAYCASKFGVVGFTRALMAELEGRVGVTLVTPGGMRTAFFDGRDDRYKPAEGAPLADPSDVASAVTFALCQPVGCEIKEVVVTGPQETSWP